MTAARPNLFARPDTFFGVCQGIGDDFGFHPNILRVAFAAMLFFSPLAAFGGYAALGAVVLASRLIAPARGRAAKVAATLPAAANTDAADLPLAA